MIDAMTERGDLLADAARRLAAAGVDHPAREARWIWEKVTGVLPGEVTLGRGEALAGESLSRWTQALDRRCAGEPLAYVLGEAGFRHLMLRSDARALIPRPETEGLVDLVLSRCPTGRALDVGTGTGCIALSLAEEGRYQLVVAIECSEPALSLARENVGMSGLPVHLVRGNLSNLARTEAFDVLVSNPPYLSDAEHGALDASVKDWEPSAALIGGLGGLELTHQLLLDGLRVVKPGGWIALELDCTRAAIAGQFARDLGWADISLLDDLFGRARYLLARRSD